MSFVELLVEWERDERANGLMSVQFDVSPTEGSTLESLAESAVDLLTAPSVDVSDQSL